MAFFDKAEENLSAFEALTSANARIVALEKELTDLKATSADGAVNINNLNTELAVIKTALEAKETETKNLQSQLDAEKRKALDVLAAQGIAPDMLPASAPNGNPTGAQQDPITKLRAQLEASTSPTERFTLSVQIRELLAKARK